MKPKSLETRFPTGRIKKVMQADDDVGKVAVASPVLISRALELFLQNLVDETYKVTTARNAKTVTGSHLKACIEANGTFDFLKEVVAHVPDLGNEAKEEKGAGRPRKRKDEDGGAEEEAGPSGEGFGKVQRRGGKKEGGGTGIKRQNSRKKTKEGQLEGEPKVELPFDLNDRPLDNVQEETGTGELETDRGSDSKLHERSLEEAIQKHKETMHLGAPHVDDIDDDYDDL